MSGSRRLCGVSVVAIACVLSACEFGRDRPTMPILGELSVTSDPSGAQIFVDNRSTGSMTPAVVEAAAGTREIDLRLVPSGSELFLWSGNAVVPETMQVSVNAALAGGCTLNCPFQVRANEADCLVVGFGDFCSTVFNPSFPGENEWPQGSGNDYVANLRVQVAGVVGADGGGLAGDTLASFVYQDTWIGRTRVMLFGTDNDRAELRYWSDPLTTAGPQPLVGIEVRQEVIAPTSVELENVLYFRFRLQNISADPLYRHWRPEMPATGFTLENVYAGMMLDADVGGPSDDVGTFLTGSNVAFIYDVNFQDGALLSGYAEMPPLVGLTLVETPPGVIERPVSVWPLGRDWDGSSQILGDELPGYGYRLLTAQLTAADPIQDNCGSANDEFGHCPQTQADYRLSLTAGPLTLAPSDTATFVVALVYAPPAEGQFTSGTAISPGVPGTLRPQLEAMADSMAVRAQRAVTMWPSVAP